MRTCATFFPLSLKFGGPLKGSGGGGGGGGGGVLTPKNTPPGSAPGPLNRCLLSESNMFPMG